MLPAPITEPFSNGYAGENNDAASQPAVVLDDNGFGGNPVRKVIRLFALWKIQNPLRGSNRMNRGVKLNPGRDHNVLSDGNPIIIGKNAVAIDKGIFSNGNIIAVVAAERLFQPDPFAKGTDEAV